LLFVQSSENYSIPQLLQNPSQRRCDGFCS
jgi:hypothetical protein